MEARGYMVSTRKIGTNKISNYENLGPYILVSLVGGSGNTPWLEVVAMVV